MRGFSLLLASGSLGVFGPNLTNAGEPDPVTNGVNLLTKCVDPASSAGSSYRGDPHANRFSSWSARLDLRSLAAPQDEARRPRLLHRVASSLRRRGLPSPRSLSDIRLLSPRRHSRSSRRQSQTVSSFPQADAGACSMERSERPHHGGRRVVAAASH